MQPDHHFPVDEVALLVESRLTTQGPDSFRVGFVFWGAVIEIGVPFRVP